MKKVILATTIAILGLTTTFVACNKSESELPTSDNNQGTTAARSACNSLDFSYINLGQKHNEIVRNALKNFSTSAYDSVNLKNNLENLDIDYTIIGYSNYDEFYNACFALNTQLSEKNYDLLQWTENSIFQTKDSIYVVRILNEIQNMESVQSVNQKLDIILNEAKNDQNLSCNELDIVIGTVSIAKSSVSLWSPVSWGGEGFYDELFPTPDGASRRTAREAVIGAIKGDVGASFTYFAGLGIGAVIGGALTPGANVAILGGWAISAGLGSIGGATGWF